MKFEALICEVTCGNRKLGERIVIMVDGTVFAKLDDDSALWRVLAAEICETMSYDPTSNSRPPKVIRMDRNARYTQECEHDVRHCRQTIERAFRECEEAMVRLKRDVEVAESHGLSDKDSAVVGAASRIAAEMYGCRQFVSGVIQGRLHKMEEQAVATLKREWEERWDTAFGDLVGETLKLQ